MTKRWWHRRTESWHYSVEVDVAPRLDAFDNMTANDEAYLESGYSHRKPADFDLHLALYLLEKEHLPEELLAPLQQWARENKMVRL